MKKSILFFSLVILISGLNNVVAQETNNYVQFGAGLGLSFRGDDMGLLFQTEYGKTFNWLDMGISTSYETEMPWNNYNSRSELWIEPSQNQTEANIPDNSYSANNSFSLSLNAGISILKLLKLDSPHAVKMGGGLGCAFVSGTHAVKNNSTEKPSYYFNTSTQIEFLPTLRVSYEYDVSEKLTLGTFLYGGKYSPCWGIGIRRNF